MEDIYEYTDEELKKLGDAIVWTAILGAVHQDGVIQASERAVAIKQAHIRTFSTENYIKPIYKHLEEHFERDFDAYSLTVTGTQEEKRSIDFFENRRVSFHPSFDWAIVYPEV